MERSDQRIARFSLECQAGYQRLCSALELATDQKTLSTVAVQNELGRFRIWIKDIGALHQDKHSLDSKLRDVDYLRHGVTLLLVDLKKTLTTGPFR